MKEVQVLALVFVQALDLHVEHRRWIDFDATLGLDISCKTLLVGELHRHELLAEFSIIGVFIDFAELVQITFPSVADTG